MTKLENEKRMVEKDVKKTRRIVEEKDLENITTLTECKREQKFQKDTCERLSLKMESLLLHNVFSAFWENLKLKENFERNKIKVQEYTGERCKGDKKDEN